MSRIKKYFKIQELVCKDVYNKYGDGAWKFLDNDLLEVLTWVRESLACKITVNDWAFGGNFSQRGLRCNLCQICKGKTLKGLLYLSAHKFGKAVDFMVEGYTANEVREFIIENFPNAGFDFNIRLEDGVTWVHLDVFDWGKKVYLFK